MGWGRRKQNCLAALQAGTWVGRRICAKESCHQRDGLFPGLGGVFLFCPIHPHRKVTSTTPVLSTRCPCQTMSCSCAAQNTYCHRQQSVGKAVGKEGTGKIQCNRQVEKDACKTVREVWVVAYSIERKQTNVCSKYTILSVHCSHTQPTYPLTKYHMSFLTTFMKIEEPKWME